MTENEYTYVVTKYTIKGERVWLTVFNPTDKEPYAVVISLPKSFNFEPKEVVIKG